MALGNRFRPSNIRKASSGELLLVLGLVVIGGTYGVSAVTAPPIPDSANGPALVSVQGSGLISGEIVAYDERGEVNWTISGETSYFCAERLPERVFGGTVLACFANPDGTTGIQIIDPLAPGEPAVTWEMTWEVRSWGESEIHDAEYLGEGRFLVAEMEYESIFIVDGMSGDVEWRWNASEHYEPPADPTRTDWLHINDVDRIEPGRYLVSVRNTNQLLIIERDVGVVEVVNEAGDPAVINQQHNPQYLEEGRILVADSENDRVVELAMSEGSWHPVWSVEVVGGIALDWPRDADRLPDGSTFITDSRNHRAVIVSERGHLLASYPGSAVVYEADRLPYGESTRQVISAVSEVGPGTSRKIPILSDSLAGAHTIGIAPWWLTETHIGLTYVGSVLLVMGMFRLAWMRLLQRGEAIQSSWDERVRPTAERAYDVIRNDLRENLWFNMPLLYGVWVAVPLYLRAVSHLNLSADAALFHYSGWQWYMFGRVPYRYLWDSKPPLTHELLAILAAVTNGEPTIMFALSSAVNVGLVLGTMAASMILVHELTGSDLAGFMTGAAFFAFPAIFAFSATGFRPKYAFVLCMLLVLLSGIRGRWVWGTAAAGVAAAFWQPGLLLVLVILVTIEVGVRRGEIPARVRTNALAALGGLGVIVVLPIVLYDALPEMLIQVVAAPVVTADGGSGLGEIVSRIEPVLFIIGSLGLVGAAFRPGQDWNRAARWWPTIFMAAVVSLLMFVDFDGIPDEIPLSVMLTVGIGLTMAVARPRGAENLLSDPRFWIGTIVFAYIILIPTDQHLIRNSHLADLFLNQDVSRRCHLRLSKAERDWIRMVGSSVESPTCWRPSWWP